MNEENSLLTGAVRPALLRYALPIILSMVATQFYAVADTMIIGLRLDADALAAVSNASTVLMIFLFISGGMELGGGLLVAAGKPTATKREMTELLYNLLFVDEVIALLTTAVGFVTLPALLRLINTPAEILDTAVLYGRIYLMGLPFLMPYDLSKECVMGCGDSKTPLKVIVATSAMNIVLDLVLVGPFGVAGAAAATAAAQVAVCIGLRGPLLRLFTTDPAAASYGCTMLAFESVTCLFVAQKHLFEARLRGAQKMGLYLASNLGQIALNLLACVILVPRIGFAGFWMSSWISAPIGMLLAAALANLSGTSHQLP